MRTKINDVLSIIFIFFLFILPLIGFPWVTWYFLSPVDFWGRLAWLIIAIVGDIVIGIVEFIILWLVA